MSALRNFWGSIKGLIPSIVKNARDAITSGTLGAQASAAFSAVKGVLGKFKNGQITLPTSISSVPKFLQSATGAIKTVIPAIKPLTGTVADILFATGKKRIDEAMNTYEDRSDSSGATLKLRNARNAVKTLQLDEDVGGQVSEMESVDPDRLYSSTKSFSEEQKQVVISNLTRAIESVRSLAPGANVGQNGVVPTGALVPWHLNTPSFVKFHTGAMNGLGVAPSEDGHVRVYDDVSKKSAAVPYSAPISPVIEMPALDLPKSGCYNWCRKVIVKAKVEYTAAYAAFGTLALKFYNDGELVKEVPLPDQGANGNLEVNIPLCLPSSAVNLDVNLVCGIVPSETVVNVHLSVDSEGSRGSIKNNLTSCGVTEVDYFDGTAMRALSSDSTWYDVLGKVNRDSETPFGDMDDPNLNAKRIWADMTDDSDFVARIARILDSAMLETAADGDNNHNKWIYDRFNSSTLSDFGNPANWIYSDSVMGGLSVDEKREAYHYFLNHIESSIELLSSHSTLQSRMYKALSDPDA